MGRKYTMFNVNFNVIHFREGSRFRAFQNCLMPVGRIEL